MSPRYWPRSSPSCFVQQQLCGATARSHLTQRAISSAAAPIQTEAQLHETWHSGHLETSTMDRAPTSAASLSNDTDIMVFSSKVNLYDLSLKELRNFVLHDLKLRGMTGVVMKHLYAKGKTSTEEFPRALRKKLRKTAVIGAEDWRLLARQESSLDGTVKVAYGVPGGHAIEAVLMNYDDGRRTACISSQVGCAQGCVFCATGQMGFKRHLTAGEIFEQAARFSAELRQKGERLSQVILLGMGEPLANYKHTVEAIRRINSLLGVGMRHITVSTVGLVPEIRRLAEEDLQITLAISLHAATDDERSKLLPVNRRYPIHDLMEAAAYYQKRSTRRVSFEWTLIDGENSDSQTADQLGKLIGLYVPGAHVNVIPLNPTSGYIHKPADSLVTQRFVSILRSYGIEATVRVRRGIDINAGCGQLAERFTPESESASPVDAVEPA